MIEFGTYDFETYNWEFPLCFGIHYQTENSEDKQDFYLNREKPADVSKVALQILESVSYEQGIKTWWAHNGGKYDVLFIVDALKSFPGWKCDGVLASGRVISLKVMSPRVTFELKDSIAVIQSALDKALESFEIPVKKVFTKEDYEGVRQCTACLKKENEIHSCMLSHSDKKLELGCLADCEALFLLMVKAQEMFSSWGGKLKGTFSASALTVVKASLGNKLLPSHKGQQGINATAYDAFSGGRVEIYKHRPAPRLREYDVTSSYPWSMSQPVPWHLIGHGNPDIFNPNLLSVVQATVNVPEQAIPPLPYRINKKGLFFPFGRWTGWFTSVELAYAIERCGVTAVFHDAINYTVENPFAGFIESVFKLKAEAAGAMREFCKLVMNGCYGKFAQKPENEKLRIFPNKTEAIKWYHENLDKDPAVVSRDGTALSIKSMRWPMQTHYAMAATITARSRILLCEALKLACNPSYCDTDSIHAIKTVWLDERVNEKLGGFKIELDDYTARFYAPKLYTLHSEKEFKHNGKMVNDVYASKGFPVSADAFQRIVKGSPVGNPKGRMQLLKSQLRHSDGVRHLIENETEKAWSGRSSKRRVLPYDAEGSTVAWNVRELQEGVHLEQQSPISVFATEPKRAEARRRA